MRVITAPDRMSDTDTAINDPSLFVAGGITGTSNWQAEYLEMLGDVLGITAVNPRRPCFDATDPSIAREQIQWEWEQLSRADAVSFWFPKETVCPITLYELGVCTQETVLRARYGRGMGYINQELFVGVHPDYSRRIDVEIQTGLRLPRLKIVYSLADLAGQVKDWVYQGAGQVPY